MLSLSLRFKVTLEAQTAAMQRQGEIPVTYLNKGQYYTVTLQDLDEYDGEIESVIKATFHEVAHRKLAARYWSFWLSQAPNPKAARALDIGKSLMDSGQKYLFLSLSLSLFLCFVRDWIIREVVSFLF